ncbi:MAG: hypothetical protein FD153_1731 [Rhodospirillaceae bacterium]|nr:MAG: hypothetical protein FD153_1731 [Rhodospirillaceae bacterium]
MKLRYGSAIIRLPDDATPDMARDALAQYRQTPDFDARLDRDTGAPFGVRGIVGSSPPGDKLANLRQYYSDAEPYQDDNFVFTHPQTRRPTLFNPSGLDPGDVAGAAREGAVMVGAGLGAAAGATTGAALGLPTGPGTLLTGASGAVMGAGVGGALSGVLFDAVLTTMSGRQDTRTLTEHVLDTSTDFAFNAAGQQVGIMAGQAIKRAAGGGKAIARDLVEQFQRLGVSGGRGLQTVEKTLDASPFSADVMQAQAERVLEQTKAAADDLAAQFGPVLNDKQSIGELVRAASATAAERFKFTQEKAYDEAFTLIGAQTPTPPVSIKALRQQMEGELSDAPASLTPVLEPALLDLARAGNGCDEQWRGHPFRGIPSHPDQHRTRSRRSAAGRIDRRAERGEEAHLWCPHGGHVRGSTVDGV